MPIPKKYAWLGSIGTLPKVISEGLALYGTLEAPGAANNPVILGWAREVGKDVAAAYGADSIPWCGLFAAVVVKRAGKPVIAGPLWARNWAKFGAPSPKASLGDVLVFVRDGGGHVGFYIAEDDQAYHVLGGNQSDAVTITRILKSRCIAVRRPPMTTPPASMKPYRVAATGGLSTNEA
ncbi:TIGR02594 family protein [Sphingomonas colocasiae]|uniref:TIGR02594 family protein n=1 Tax=Sphingomonas colocasiae TaxID=1848973 RepID=A0ABS7PXP9_9SPHN|nr:TIGR02594 family protein [Sphingomonas colocasiae]MBY8826130.1 TIGR02594 family protein [Sphingomonas colocasiae]